MSHERITVRHGTSPEALNQWHSGPSIRLVLSNLKRMMLDFKGGKVIRFVGSLSNFEANSQRILDKALSMK